MTATDTELLHAYMRGWDDEYYIARREKPPEDTGDPYLQHAYDIGRDHYVIGDDLRSVDGWTHERIIKLIKRTYENKSGNFRRGRLETQL